MYLSLTLVLTRELKDLTSRGKGFGLCMGLCFCVLVKSCVREDNARRIARWSATKRGAQRSQKRRRVFPGRIRDKLSCITYRILVLLFL